MYISHILFSLFYILCYFRIMRRKRLVDEMVLAPNWPIFSRKSSSLRPLTLTNKRSSNRSFTIICKRKTRPLSHHSGICDLIIYYYCCYIYVFSGKPYTKVTFYPDFSKFIINDRPMHGIDSDLEKLILKRTVDVAGCSPHGVRVRPQKCRAVNINVTFFRCISMEIGCLSRILMNMSNSFYGNKKAQKCSMRKLMRGINMWAI